MQVTLESAHAVCINPSHNLQKNIYLDKFQTCSPACFTVQHELAREGRATLKTTAQRPGMTEKISLSSSKMGVYSHHYHSEHISHHFSQ